MYLPRPCQRDAGRFKGDKVRIGRTLSQKKVATGQLGPVATFLIAADYWWGQRTHSKGQGKRAAAKGATIQLVFSRDIWGEVNPKPTAFCFLDKRT